MSCTECGWPIIRGARFCNQCGAPVVRDASEFTRKARTARQAPPQQAMPTRKLLRMPTTGEGALVAAAILIFMLLASGPVLQSLTPQPTADLGSDYGLEPDKVQISAYETPSPTPVRPQSTPTPAPVTYPVRRLTEEITYGLYVNIFMTGAELDIEELDKLFPKVDLNSTAWLTSVDKWMRPLRRNCLEIRLTDPPYTYVLIHEDFVAGCNDIIDGVDYFNKGLDDLDSFYIARGEESLQTGWKKLKDAKALFDRMQP